MCIRIDDLLAPPATASAAPAASAASKRSLIGGAALRTALTGLPRLASGTHVAKRTAPSLRTADALAAASRPLGRPRGANTTACPAYPARTTGTTRLANPAYPAGPADTAHAPRTARLA
ncbi:MAG: hypothetical protein ACREFP_10360, partial [Acetobacteraceae bacterium]